jgi:hypothetical protein
MKLERSLRGLALAFCVAVASPMAAADVLLLKDGRIIEGKPLVRDGEAVAVKFENGEVRVPKELVLEAVIENEALGEPASAEEAEQRKKGMVRFEGRWVTQRARDDAIGKRIAERKRAAEELKGYRLWRNAREERTKNFAYKHNVPAEVFASYRDLMETYFKDFCRAWKVKPSKDQPPLAVNLYYDYDGPDGFLQVSGAGWGVLGYFRYVEPMDLNFYYDRLDPRGTEEVMFHEANHYLQKLIDVRFSYPHFPGESLAEFYGASSWDPQTKKITTGLVLEGRLVEVQTDISAGKWVGLEALASTEDMYEHYTWGWSLVHFLMNREALAAKFQKFVLALPSAKDVKRETEGFGLTTVRQADVFAAFKLYMGLKDADAVRELERQWHAYVRDELKVTSARGLEQAAMTASRTYPPRPIRAKRLFKEALDKGSENPVAFHRYGQLLAADGEKAAARELFEKALARDPLEASFYDSLASVLPASESAESERLRKLAQEIEPNAFREIVLGR